MKKAIKRFPRSGRDVRARVAAAAVAASMAFGGSMAVAHDVTHGDDAWFGVHENADLEIAWVWNGPSADWGSPTGLEHSRAPALSMFFAIDGVLHLAPLPGGDTGRFDYRGNPDAWGFVALDGATGLQHHLDEWAAPDFTWRDLATAIAPPRRHPDVRTRGCELGDMVDPLRSRNDVLTAFPNLEEVGDDCRVIEVGPRLQPDTGAEFRIIEPNGIGGGVLVMGERLYYADGEGWMQVRSLRTGEYLWSFYGVGHSLTPPITYVVDGDQFIAVATRAHGGALGSAMPGRPHRYSYGHSEQVVVTAFRLR